MQNNHCCAEMNFFLKENKVDIGYSARFRMYFIKLSSSEAVQTIFFCPWCGSKLPKVLDEEYDEALKASGIDIDELGLDAYLDPNLPEEFKTDAWWKERGL